MAKIDIFSPFYWKKSLTNQEQRTLYDDYVPKMVSNYDEFPRASGDWNVHTSYNMEDQLPHRLVWNISTDIYKKYVNEFLLEFFGKPVDWEIVGHPWYTAYGSGQTANIHEHIPDHFSFVHFIKFDPRLHWPISFINPQGAMTKYMLGMFPELKDKIDFNNQHQSLFHPRFTPMIDEGDIVIFPASLEHMVEKVDNGILRITIAFNIRIK